MAKHLWPGCTLRLSVYLWRVFFATVSQLTSPQFSTRSPNGKEQQLTQALDKALGSLDLSIRHGGGEDGEDDFHDFVLLKFDP